jgi:tetratricopeptide (TPR) repeat protein
VEEGVELGGIAGDVEEARFVSGRFEECIAAVMSFAEAIARNGSGTSRLPAVARRQVYSVIPIGEVEESWGPEVKQIVEEIRAKAAAEQFVDALELSSKALRLQPECWRARINKGVALVHLRRYVEAEREFDIVAASFASMATVVATALHNKAWLLGVRDGLGDRASVARRKELYLQALALDNRRIFTRAMVLICMVLLHEEDQARPFLEASLKWNGFVTALREEIQALGGLGFRVLTQLPPWLRDVLFPHEGLNTKGDLQ